MKDVVILGTGNHDIIKLLEAINADKPTFRVQGFLERDESKIGLSIRGVPICGHDDLLLSEFKQCGVIVNVFQTPQIHQQVCNNIMVKYGVTDFPNIVHPTTDINTVNIGRGNIIFEFVNFGSYVKIGNFNSINSLTTIGHETVIGNSNLLASRVAVGSRALIGDCNVFSVASVLSNSYMVGDNNFLGVGSVVLNNLNDNENVLGNPAKETLRVLRDHYKGLKPEQLKLRTTKRKL